MTIQSPLPFWTPVLSPSQTQEEPSFTNNCSWFVENYFYWGAEAASPNPLNDREVQVIPMPQQHSSVGTKVLFSVLTALSYLTVIVPIIMAIAKCILRCGQDYVVIEEEQQPRAEETQEESPPASTPAPTPSVLVLSQERELREKIYEATRNSAEFQGAVPCPLAVPASDSDKLEAQEFIARWQDSTDSSDSMQRELRGLTNAQRWNILEECATYFPTVFEEKPQLVSIVHNTTASLLNISDPIELSIDRAKTNDDFDEYVQGRFNQKPFSGVVKMYVVPERAAGLFDDLLILFSMQPRETIADATKVLLETFKNNCPRVASIPIQMGGEVWAQKICCPAARGNYLIEF